MQSYGEELTASLWQAIEAQDTARRAQIEERLDAFSEKVATTQQNIEALRQGVDTLHQGMSELHARLTALEENEKVDGKEKRRGRRPLPSMVTQAESPQHYHSDTASSSNRKYLNAEGCVVSGDVL